MSEAEGEDRGDSLPELCDLCGATVPDRREFYALVPDSSVIHRVDPQYDGKRLLTGCTREHLKQLVEQYKVRPFVEPELWAGKIGRAMEQHPEGLGEEDLVEETGLTLAQIELGVMWQDMDARLALWRRQFGKGQGPEPDGTADDGGL